MRSKGPACFVPRAKNGKWDEGMTIHINNAGDVTYEIEVVGITADELRAIAPLGCLYGEPGDFRADFGTFALAPDGETILYYGSAGLGWAIAEGWQSLDPVDKRRFRRWWGEDAPAIWDATNSLSGEGSDDINSLNAALCEWRAGKDER